jgi:hypothetical protein
VRTDPHAWQSREASVEPEVRSGDGDTTARNGPGRRDRGDRAYVSSSSAFQ